MGRVGEPANAIDALAVSLVGVNLLLGDETAVGDEIGAEIDARIVRRHHERSTLVIDRLLH